LKLQSLLKFLKTPALTNSQLKYLALVLQVIALYQDLMNKRKLSKLPNNFLLNPLRQIRSIFNNKIKIRKLNKILDGLHRTQHLYLLLVQISKVVSFNLWATIKEIWILWQIISLKVNYKIQILIHSCQVQQETKVCHLAFHRTLPIFQKVASKTLAKLEKLDS
jgi:hypothetical protein